MPRGLSSKRKSKNVILIVCEGNKTERLYFEELKRHKRLPTTQIKFPKTMKTDPVGIVKHAIKLVENESIDFKFGDQVWCVFDADNNTQQQLDKANKLAGKNIKLFLSNPSFEIWYLLHFELYKDSINNEDLLNRLKNHIIGYEKNKCYYTQVLNRQTDAITNAKALVSMHTENDIDLFSIKSNPSTQIYKILEKIETLI